MPRKRPAQNSALLLTVCVVGMTLATHWSVLDIQFWLDDFTDIRPWSSAELAAGLRGAWDPYGVSEPYYRPLTVLYQAWLFKAFGFTPMPMHAISLLLTMAAAWLLGTFVARETDDDLTGIWAAWLFILHPALPESAAAWIKNHPHLISCVFVAAMLLYWQRVRAQAWIAWWPIWVLALVGAAFKEDVIMVLVALPVLQWAQARMGRGPALSPATALAAGAVCVAYLAFRSTMLPAFGTHDSLGEMIAQLSPLAAAREYLSAQYHAIGKFLVTAPFQSQAATHWPSTIAAVVLLLAAASTIVGRPQHVLRNLAVSGMVLMAVLGLPLAIIAGTTRIHLLVLGSALVLAAGARQVSMLTTTRGWSLSGLVLSFVAIAFWNGSRANTMAYLPCGPFEDENARVMLAVPHLSADLRAFLEQRNAQCAAGDLSDPLRRMGQLRWTVDGRDVIETAR